MTDMCPWCHSVVSVGVEGYDPAGHPARWHAACALRVKAAALRARKGRPAVVPPPPAEGRADFVSAAFAGPPERCLADEEPAREVSGAPYEDPTAQRYERDRHRRLSRKEAALALAAVYGEAVRKKLMGDKW